MSNVIYPPILDTYSMPVVKGSQIYKIPFSLSSFNTLSEIAPICITTVNEIDTNYSIIKDSTEMVFSEIKSNGNSYWIELRLDLNRIEELFINNYYKVQIRFCKKGSTPDYMADISAESIPHVTPEWLSENMDNLSEWSTITLIRVISQPSIQLKCEALNGVYKSNPFLSLPGELFFQDKEEKSKLKSFRVVIVGAGIDSGIQYTSKNFSFNSFQYNSNTRIDLEGQTSKRFNGMVYYTLDSLYEGVYNFQIDILQNYYTIPSAEIEVLKEFTVAEDDSVFGHSIDEYPGRTFTINGNKNGNLTVKLTFKVDSSDYKIALGRFCSKQNFNNLEILYIYDDITPGVKQETFYVDNTVESGIWYKYCIIAITAEGVYGTPIEAAPAMSFFEDQFLSADNKVLKIKFNPVVNGYKKNVLESKTETIGSKYAFVKRNADVEYRQFSIGGLISFLENENNIFCTKNELYNNNEEVMNLYNSFNIEQRINQYNDYITERFYRERVMEFLYKDNIKLFRSLPEGNVLVKLMNINLTPKTELGRYIYSFSADAIEMDECSVENYKKYDIMGAKEIVYEKEEEGTDLDNLVKPDFAYVDKQLYGTLKNIMPTKEDIEKFGDDSFNLGGIKKIYEGSESYYYPTKANFMINLDGDPNSNLNPPYAGNLWNQPYGMENCLVIKYDKNDKYPNEIFGGIPYNIGPVLIYKGASGMTDIVSGEENILDRISIDSIIEVVRNYGYEVKEWWEEEEE